MKESDWLNCADAGKMLEYYVWEISDRKLLLFGVGCCRRISSLFVDQRSVNAVQVADRYLDDLASREDLNEACEAAQHVFVNAFQPQDVASFAPVLLAENNIHGAMIRLAQVAAYATGDEQNEEKLQQAALLRHIIGNPFRPIQFCRSWQTPTTTALAQAIYDDNESDRIPILGDALEDAGCTDAYMLSYCRSATKHVRGCWLVDLILGKK